MTPQELKNSILQQAIQGKLVEQRPEEGTAEELFEQIQKEKQRLIADGKIKKEKPLPEITEEEKPFDIPESWKWVRLGEIVTVLGDGIHGTPQFDEAGEYFFINGNNLANGKIIIKTDTKKVSRTEFEKYRKPLDGNSILISINGTIGNYAFYHDEPVILGKSACYFSLMKEMNKEYICRLLNTQHFMDYAVKEATQTTIKNVSLKSMRMLPIPLPPLAEQKRIVAKIEELLPYIHRYEEAWLKLEAFNSRFPDDMKKSLLQYAIQGKLVEQRPEEGTAEELFERIQKEKQRLIAEGKIKKEKPLPEITEGEKPFDIPESWKWVRIGDVCINIQYGSSQKSSQTGKIAVLRMGNLQDGKIILDKLVYTSDEEEIKKYPLQYGDLLFNRTNSKELVGKTAIYRGEIPAIYAGYLVRLTPLLAESDYINYVMQSTFYWNYCQSVRSDAIGQSNINAEKLKRFEFPLPPLPEQKRIVAKLEELLPLCERLK